MEEPDAELLGLARRLPTALEMRSIALALEICGSEKDRLEPVDPSKRIELEAQALARYPEGYRHVAYLQTGAGVRITPDLPTPGKRGAEAAVCRRRGLARPFTDAPRRSRTSQAHEGEPGAYVLRND